LYDVIKLFENQGKWHFGW